MPIAKLCLVAGRMQGVYYRASTQQQAQRLHVNGYAKNLADGRVEVLAVGEAEQVDALVKWLWQGSPASEVTSVDVHIVEPPELPAGFQTR
jgi:acylphosphatase